MDLVAVVFVIHLTLATFCHGWSLGGAINYISEPGDETQECRDNDKPCAILVREFEDDDTMRQEYTSELCRCGGDAVCNMVWGAEPQRTIARYLKTNDKDMILEMKFCRNVQPLNECGHNQVALSLKGRNILPQEVTQINCQCPGNSTLHLQRVWNERYLERHQNFVCVMPTCDQPTADRPVPCFLASSRLSELGEETTYMCDCPSDFRCVPALDLTLNQFSLGHCMRPGNQPTNA